MIVRVKLCVPISALAPAVTAAADVASVVIAVSATAVTDPKVSCIATATSHTAATDWRVSVGAAPITACQRVSKIPSVALACTLTYAPSK